MIVGIVRRLVEDKGRTMNITAADIKAARERNQMTQQDLAEAVGVSLRTVGAWERGENVPRNRMGAIREVLGLPSADLDERSNLSELSRLIREQLEVLAEGPDVFAKRLPAEMKRAFYNWRAGTSTPQVRTRAVLEDALGWERGSISRILEAPITERISLAEVRDWGKVGGEPFAVQRAAELSTQDLLTELTRRVLVLEEENELLKREGKVIPINRNRDQSLYHLAADNMDAARDTEHLDDK